MSRNLFLPSWFWSLNIYNVNSKPAFCCIYLQKCLSVERVKVTWKMMNSKANFKSRPALSWEIGYSRLLHILVVLFHFNRLQISAFLTIQLAHVRNVLYHSSQLTQICISCRTSSFDSSKWEFIFDKDVLEIAVIGNEFNNKSKDTVEESRLSRITKYIKDNLSDNLQYTTKLQVGYSCARKDVQS